jgi:hypothetical protein
LRCGPKWIDTIEGDGISVLHDIGVDDDEYAKEAIDAINRMFFSVITITKRNSRIIVEYRNGEEAAYVKVDPWPNKNAGYWEYDRSH